MKYTNNLGRRSKLLHYSSAFALSAALAATSTAATSARDEIFVTATKRSQSLQSVAVSVEAFTGEELAAQGVESFEDYALLSPSMSYMTTGPGSTIVYLRGMSDGGDGNPALSPPVVALYMDEQPISNIGRAADMHVYDMQRIEVMKGPQGTLYGASSMAGTIKLVTNKPSTDGFEAGVDAGIATTNDGDMSYVAEGYANIPLSDNAAIRLVAWHKDEGGYIDNVYGEHTHVTGATVDNAGLLEEDYNDVQTTGMRASARVALNDVWTATLVASYQDTEGHGASAYDPTIGDLEAARFTPETQEDEVLQVGFTLEGELGDVADIIYAGSYFKREFFERNDYTLYSDTWAVYYSYETGPGYLPTPMSYTDTSEWTRATHEIRISSKDDGSKLQWLVGLFYDRTEHEYAYLYEVPSLMSSWSISSPPFYSFGPPPKPGVWWESFNVRTDKQTAIFGEITYNFTDQLSGTVGGRLFENDFSTVLIHGYGGAFQPNVGSDSERDNVMKANLTYRLSDDVMTWFTFSQGYRQGGFNRTPGAFVGYPDIFESDSVDSFEVGYKSAWLDNRLILNGAVFMVNWSNTQVSSFDYSLSPLGWAENLDTGIDVVGTEMEVNWDFGNGFTASGGFSLVNAESEGDYIKGGSSVAPPGTTMPLIPELKWNISARYDFDMANDVEGFAQITHAYVDEMYNLIEVAGRDLQESYSITNLRFGVSHGTWGAELYVNNAADERAEIFINPFNFDSRIETNRPRTIGVKLSAKFN